MGTALITAAAGRIGYELARQRLAAALVRVQGSGSTCCGSEGSVGRTPLSVARAITDRASDKFSVV
jgi:hypothetical protein